MKCKECQEKVVQYLQHELDEDEKKRFEKHLSDCKDCQVVIKKTEELMQVIENSPVNEPSANLRSNFMEDLEVEKSKSGSPKASQVYLTQSFYRVAAAIALLVVGFSAGTLMSSENSNVTELSELKSEVQSMKQMVMVSMLRDESASERIQAVNYVDSFDEPSQEVIETLLRTLNEDESPNVRRAAIKGLGKFTYDENVRLMLIRSFEFQTDPVVQITLIDLMVELDEKRAAKKFQQLIDQENIEEIVKKQAEIGLQFLI